MKITNTEVYGLKESLVASGFPFAVDLPDEETFLEMLEDLSDKDIERGLNLSRAKIGSGHDNFLNGIVVQFNLKATNKIWVELERYHFIDFVSSCSTMHKISDFDLSADEAYIEYVDPQIIDIMIRLQKEYNNNPTKENYYKLLYSNPAGFRLGARMTTNYRQLRTMYNQRKNHKLEEWHSFARWVEGLPMSKLITQKGEYS